MLQVQVGKAALNCALIVVDMQNGFISKGGSYYKLNMNTERYQKVVPVIKKLIEFCRTEEIPIFYTQAVRERSGIDLLINAHNILPSSREERLEKFPICVRGTWDAKIVDVIKPTRKDHVIIKRRDSAFMDTELRVWLQSVGVNTLVFCGIDTSICVETSLRDAFNLGYDIILVSDCTSSRTKKHFDTTLERVRDYYGVVTHFHEFKDLIKMLKEISVGKLEFEGSPKRISEFLEKHKLIDVSRLR
jgi:ureidoacrylate peracid hydrolase